MTYGQSNITQVLFTNSHMKCLAKSQGTVSWLHPPINYVGDLGRKRQLTAAAAEAQGIFMDAFCLTVQLSSYARARPRQRERMEERAKGGAEGSKVDPDPCCIGIPRIPRFLEVSL